MDSPLCLQLRVGLAESTAITQITLLTLSRFLDECSDGHAGFTCCDTSMYQNSSGILVTFAAETCKCVDEIGLAWFLKGSSFGVDCSFIGVEGRWKWIGRTLLRLIPASNGGERAQSIQMAWKA